MKWFNSLPIALLCSILSANEILRKNLSELQESGEQTVAHLLSATPKDKLDELFAILENLEKAEISRREQLDSKGNSLLSGATLALTALGTAGTLLLATPKESNIMLSAIMFVLPWTLVLCCVYWSGAVLMVYKSLNIVQFDVLCCQSVRALETALKDGLAKEELAKEQWLNAVLNEPRLTIKSNWLSGARTLYETGITILLLSIFLVMVLISWPWILFGIWRLLPVLWIMMSFVCIFFLGVIMPPLMVFYVKSKIGKH